MRVAMYYSNQDVRLEEMRTAPKTRKVWRQKLEIEREPEMVDDPRGRGTMLIPKPLDVDALICKIEKGNFATVKQIKERLAKDFHADFTCLLSTGIFVRIAAEVAEEVLSKGEKALKVKDCKRASQEL